MKPRAALWRFAIAGACALVLLVLVINVLRQPVAGETRSYTAEFTDVSGLHLDADVRYRGVRVGKVTSIDLIREAGQSIAAVGFTLERRYAVVPTTRLAVKFQALTGLRYIDVLAPAEGDPGDRLVAHAPTTMTQPSLDITRLFNGLQPVLATLSPEEINTFTATVADYLEGDGTGLGPLLDSVRKLTEFVDDRQAVIATLMRNLDDVSEGVGGHSKDFIQLLDWVNRPVDAGLDVLEEFRKSDLYGPGFMSEVVRLLANFGLEPGIDVADGFDRAIEALDRNIEAIKRVPVVWENIPPPDAKAPLPCSRGPAQLPATMDVLLNGQKVILCNR